MRGAVIEQTDLHSPVAHDLGDVGQNVLHGLAGLDPEVDDRPRGLAGRYP